MKTPLKTTTQRLGLDFGRVIMGATIQGQEDTSFLGCSLEAAIQSPATEGAFEAVQQLVERFQGQVWIISKCGPSVQRKTRAWLEHQGFAQRTGWQPENLRFCLKRPEKAGICEEIGITHFVDDRMDVLQAMREEVPHRYLFGEQDPGFVCPGDVNWVLNWNSVVREFQD